MSAKWETFGDVNMFAYGGGFIRHVADKRYHIIEVINMDEACGSDNDGHPRYVIELSEVDVAIADLEAVASSCGFEVRDGKMFNDDVELPEIFVAEEVRRYGQHAPLESWSTNNPCAKLTQARALSLRLERDANEYEERMNRPVNRIGSTAREFQRGDIDSAMARGLLAGDKSTAVLAKISGKILAPPAPSHDPLAFAMGYMDGLQGQEKADPGEDTLAPEYVRGFEVGERVRAGTQMAPEWIK